MSQTLSSEGEGSQKVEETTVSRPARSRIASIDVMRGLVIIIMALDHVREKIFLHHPISDPLDLDTTLPDLFFTRIAAHICAPVFVFLTGMSAWLYSKPSSGGTRSPSGFLFKRGLFLVVLELTLITFSWTASFSTIYLQVIWAIGLSMIALSAMVRLPYWSIAVAGVVIVFGHNLLTPISFAPGETGYALWTILHDRGFLVAEGLVKIKVSYPVLPWIGLIFLGYVAGPIYSRTRSAESRTKALLVLGVACLLLFAVLRGFNIYGETLPWEHGVSSLQTIMSFINLTKYPPSLSFLLATMGLAFLLMVKFDAMDNRVTRVLARFGSAPMFFYAVHLYVLIICFKTLTAIYGLNQGTRFGVDDIWMVWAATAILVFALYFPTSTFSKFKRVTDKAWVKYF